MINVNIVGSINDEEQLSEIETVAKVFVVERRINTLTYNVKANKIVSRPQIIPKNKEDKQKNSYNKNLTLLTVRGFNWFLVKFI